MKIEPYIQELLYNHDCVIVPDFGGILANYTPAQIDKDKSTLYPPRKILSFNQNLKSNDGLLVGKISKRLNISYPEAKQFVEEQVSSIKHQLVTGEKVVFNQIGVFTNNSEGNIQFEPDTTANYLLDAYGLVPVSVNVIGKYNTNKRSLYPTDKEPVRVPSVRKYLWRAAVIVPLIALMVAVPLKTNIFKNNIETVNMNPLAATELEINRRAIDEPADIIKGTAVDEPADIIKETVVDESADIIKETVVDESADIIKETVVDEPAVVETAERALLEVAPVTSVSRESLPATGESFNIITGSFKIRQNAEYQAEMLRKDGFSPEITETSNGFFRVSAGKYNDMETASQLKASIENSYPGSWIRVQK